MAYQLARNILHIVLKCAVLQKYASVQSNTIRLGASNVYSSASKYDNVDYRITNHGNTKSNAISVLKEHAGIGIDLTFINNVLSLLLIHSLYNTFIQNNYYLLCNEF